MEWAIVAVVLVAVAGVGWYVLRSTPSAADIGAAAPSTTPAKPGQPDPTAPGFVPRGQNVVAPDLTDPAVRARIQASADALARAAASIAG